MDSLNNISQEELELLERFWTNQFIDENEKRQLKESYDRDPVWRRRADEVRLLQTGISEAVLEQKLDAFHTAIQAPQKQAPVRRLPAFKWAAAAAIIGVLALGGYFLNAHSKNNTLFATYYKPDPGLPTLMGVSDNYEFEKAMVDYKIGNYETAIQTWETLLNNAPDNDTLHYFIASAYLAQEKIDLSIGHFDSVLKQPKSAFQHDALWFKALALIRKKEFEKSILLLEKTEHTGRDELLLKIKEQ